MSCRDKTVSRIYQKLVDYSRRRVGRDAGDLVGDLVMMVYEHDRFEELCERGELERYMYGCINISSRSVTSPYYMMYRRCNVTEIRGDWHWLGEDDEWLPEGERDETPVDHSQREWLEDRLEELPWFEAELLYIYYIGNHTLQSISDDTGISKSTISKAIRNARQALKEAHAKEEEDAAQGTGGRRGASDGGDRDQEGGQGDRG